MKPHGLIIIFFAALLFSGCTQENKKSDPPPKQRSLTMADLTEFLTGSFSSAEQAASDSEYFDIRLEIWPIWLYRSDAHWLYVERAIASHLSRPFLQEVYAISPVDDSTFKIESFRIPEPERFANRWRDDIPLSGINPDSLIERPNYVLLLRCEGDSVFVGTAINAGCPDSSAGVVRAITEMRITADHLYIWNREWDKDTLQISGPVTGGYIFKKSKNTKE